jgi:hypothetical protein
MLIFFLHNKNLQLKNKHSDKDEEICHHHLSSPTTTSIYPFTQTLPLIFVAVARAVVVRWHWWWR